MLRRKTTKTKTLGQDTKGRYLKNIVRVRPPKSGKISQRKFYLGHDEDAARHAAARIDALWNCFEGRFQRQQHQRMIQQSFPVPHRPQPEYELVDGARQVKPYVPNVASAVQNQSQRTRRQVRKGVEQSTKGSSRKIGIPSERSYAERRARCRRRDPRPHQCD